MNADRLLRREVYGIFGIPIDTDDLKGVLQKIADASATRQPLFISTINLNFLALSHQSSEFCRTLYVSDLCTPDGMPIVWLAKMLRAPVFLRIAGSDIFDALLRTQLLRRKLRIALFGGPEGVAQRAREAINQSSNSSDCVAAINPGFGDIQSMSRGDLIDEINKSSADLLSVSLGAQKGQSWIFTNRNRIIIPVKIHLGATINFHAGTVARAPLIWRRLGAEWLWRIKEEPQLFKRYWKDGWFLLYLLLTRAVPLAISLAWSRWRFRSKGLQSHISETEDVVRISFFGFAMDKHLQEVPSMLRDVVARKKDVQLDLRGVLAVDARFMGLVLVLRECLAKNSLALELVGPNKRVHRQFRLNGFANLLTNSRDDR